MAWKNGQGIVSHVSTLNSFIDERTVNISNTVKNSIKVHLINLDSELERYFPELVNVVNWKTLIYNPFMSNVEDLPMTITQFNKNSLILLIMVYYSPSLKTFAILDIISRRSLILLRWFYV